MYVPFEDMMDQPGAGECLDAVIHVSTVEQKFEALVDYCQRYGLADVFYARVDASGAEQIVIRKWDKEWDKLYQERRYEQWDDAVRLGRQQERPFRLRRRLGEMSKRQSEFYHEAERYNRLDGFAVPLPVRSGGKGGFSTTGVEEALPLETMARICSAAYIFDLAAVSEQSSQIAEQFSITPRQRLFLRLLADGHTHREIATLLSISEDWSHKAIARMRGKLSVATDAALMYKAMKLGLLP